jgi:hypothetical protein
LVFEESELPRNGDGIMKNIYKDTKPTEWACGFGIWDSST